jgi:NADH-quinone oxidoreductase subunit H
MKGLGQPLADGLKFFLKEDYRPAHVDKILFSLAPILLMSVVIISMSVLPLGGIRQETRWAVAATAQTARDSALNAVPNGASVVDIGVVKEHVSAQRTAYVTYRYPFQIAQLNIGVLFILAVLSLGVYGVVLGGWASNNKYSFLGALRATAQMISYEIPLGLCVLCIVILYGTLDLGTIVDKQATYWWGVIPAWNCFTQPLTFVMFLICIHAEANRSPFDLAEAEQELVGGYHTEYSSMRFALFFLAEYIGMIVTSGVCVALFFGGWHLPWIDKLPLLAHRMVDASQPGITTSLGICLLRAAVFFVKTLLVIFVFMWVRWSLPRFRFDQLMMLAWRAMVPMALGLLTVTSLVVWTFRQRAYMRVGGRMGLALLFGNVMVLAVTVAIARLLPPPPQTNRRVRVADSRFQDAPPVPSGSN